MKKQLKHLLCLCLLLGITITASAHDFEVDGIYYLITSETDKTVAVSYQGSEETEYSNDYSGSVTIPSNVTYNSTTYSVTSIGERAFYRCTGLTSVTIGNSVTSIGKNAFYGCTWLTSVDIPNTVTSIGATAFYSCTRLASVSIPTSVTSIGGAAFASCKGLTTVSVPNSVTSLGDHAFEGCSGLTTITLSNSLRSIEENTFASCSKLTSVFFPKSVSSIGESAFQNCSGLTTVTLGMSVTSIGNYAFDGCTKIKSIYSAAYTPPSLGSYTFSFDYIRSTCTVYVYNSSMTAYRNATYWKTFSKFRPYTHQYTDQKLWAASELTGVYVCNCGCGKVGTLDTVTPTYTREMSNRWGTLVIPFAVTYDADNGNYKLYQLTEADIADTEGTLTFSEYDNDAVIAAGTPMVIKAVGTQNDETGKYTVTLTAGNTDISTTITPTASVNGLQMKGTYSQLTNKVDVYFIAQGQFWWAESPITIAPFRAWYEGAAPASNAPLRIVTEDETEDIQLIDSEEGTLYMVNGRCFDLQGRQIGQGHKGLQIRDGRVVMVK